MLNQNKYKIEKKKKRLNSQTHKLELIPLPVDKITGIGWEELVKVIADEGIEIAEEIRLHNVGQKGGTAKIDRTDLFKLWKQVERKRKKEAIKLNEKP
jgi:hypothetical protein